MIFLLNFVIDIVYCYNIALVILFFLICDQNFIKGRGIICRVTSDNAIFSREGSHVWPQFSQLFFNKIGEFLCLLERKFPEFSKTLPTFVFCPILSGSLYGPKTRIPLFFGTPCISRWGWIWIRMFMKGSPMKSYTKTRLRNLYRSQRGLPLFQFQTYSPAWNAAGIMPGCHVISHNI